MISAPLRLRLDGGALVHNWRWMARASGRAACGAAVKADGYGLGAAEVVRRLAAAGCRDFFVATWAEAEALMPWAEGLSLSVLHGVRAEDMEVALGSPARPVLNTAMQLARWQQAGGGACDVMVDTGMNRLGVSVEEVGEGLLNGVTIDTLMSHLACADEDSAMNGRQRDAFAALAGATGARRMSLANSAGVLLGRDYVFDLTRPGLTLYGGVPRPEAAGAIRQVVFPQAQVIQVRTVRAGDTVGYNATWRAERDTRVAILNVGYADGYPRAFSGGGQVMSDGQNLPVLGLISMDVIAVGLEPASCVGESDWLDVDFALPEAARHTGRSQYELLTGLARRFDRSWR